jgi:glycerol-3-phosphate acyltransferase PlsY
MEKEKKIKKLTVLKSIFLISSIVFNVVSLTMLVISLIYRYAQGKPDISLIYVIIFASTLLVSFILFAMFLASRTNIEDLKNKEN